MDVELLVSFWTGLVPALSTTQLIESRFFMVVGCLERRSPRQLQPMLKSEAECPLALNPILLRLRERPKKESRIAIKSRIYSANCARKCAHNKPTGRSLIRLHPDVRVVCFWFSEGILKPASIASHHHSQGQIRNI